MLTLKTDISNERARIDHGPHPGIIAIVYTLLFIGGIVASIIMIHGAPFPIPYGPLEISQKYYQQFANAVNINSFLLFSASIPLGLFTASVTSRLKFLSVNATGVNIALFGRIAS